MSNVNKNAKNATTNVATIAKPTAPATTAIATPAAAKPVNTKRAAYKAKRANKLADLKAKDVNAYLIAVTYKEAKDAGNVKDWADYCAQKAKAFSDVWLARATKPAAGMGEKKKARLAARLERMKAMQAELEKQLNG